MGCDNSVKIWGNRRSLVEGELREKEGLRIFRLYV